MTDLWAVIPAGGKGLRFGSQVPKQYMLVAGHPVLDHVLAAFLKTKDRRFSMNYLLCWIKPRRGLNMSGLKGML